MQQATPPSPAKNYKLCGTKVAAAGPKLIAVLCHFGYGQKRGKPDLRRSCTCIHIPSD